MEIKDTKSRQAYSTTPYRVNIDVDAKLYEQYKGILRTQYGKTPIAMKKINEVLFEDLLIRVIADEAKNLRPIEEFVNRLKA